MAACGYSSLVQGLCGPSVSNPASTKCVLISDCDREVKGHLRSLNVSDSSLRSESRLLLARAGIFETDANKSETLTICPRHRELYGTRWICNKKACAVPKEFAKHGSGKPKGDRGITFVQSKDLYLLSKHLVPVGSPICRRCREHIKTEASSLSANEPHFTSQPETTSAASTLEPIVENEDTDASLLEAFENLTIGAVGGQDPTFIMSSNTESSSTGELSQSQNVQCRKKLNEFLQASGKSDLVGPPKKRWHQLSTRSKNIQTSKATNTIVSALRVISPEDSGSLWNAVIESKAVEKSLGLLSSVDLKYLKALAESYENADGWDTKTQILGVMVGLVTYKEIQITIPGLTRYRFEAAKRHVLQHGRGAAVPVDKIVRVRIDDKRLDHFISFITSPHVVLDLPFGERYLKLSDGRILETPNIIRSMIPSRICNQYQQYCKETGVTPFSTSTMRRILSVCSATVRKSLHGLDYLSAEGTKAFDDLGVLVTKLENASRPRKWVEDCEKTLKTGKQYIKTDFKVHITKSSNIADHCIAHSLSHEDSSEFDVPCEHDHDHICHSCEDIKQVLQDIKEALDESAEYFTVLQHDDMRFTFQQAVSSIHAWKAHQLRCIQQDKARTDILDALGEDEVFITQDWAMKFLPQKYRETQADWFGKRGISWHISVVVRKTSQGDIQQQVYVHIMDKCSQDSSAVVAIMEHTLRSIKEENPEVSKSYYRQDNAGCYHSAEMLSACCSMERATGVKVVRVDFSDPQGGKGACDRKAASIKAHIRRYINEGHDVSTAFEMKEAIMSSGGVRGVRVVLVEGGISPLGLADCKLEGISSFNNFQVEKDGLICWRAYKIGTGKLVSWKSLQVRENLEITSINCPLSQGSFTEICTSKKKTPIEDDQSSGSDDELIARRDGNSEPKLFACPVLGCVKTFQRHSNLDNHIQFGRCKLKKEKESLFDKAMIMYHEKLQSQDTAPTMATESSQTTDGYKPAERGWALKKAKKSSRFSKEQKAFLDENFLIGQETGRKVDANTVAEQMRHAIDFHGKRRFKLEEFLTAAQVQSYFSRKTAKLKSTASSAQHPTQVPQETDIDDSENTDDLAARNESAFHEARDTILDQLHLKHPIMMDSLNLCDLVKRGKGKGNINDLTLAVLNSICLHLEIDTSGVKTKGRKKPFVELINSVVEKCSCFQEIFV